MKTVLITGGTGMIGTALATFLVGKGYRVIILSRKNKAPSGNISFATWDTKINILDPKAIEGANYIVHLAGEGIADKRWTASRKKAIVESRVKSSQLLVEAIQKINNKIEAVISVSGSGYYPDDRRSGNSPARAFTETDLPGTGFLSKTCVLWEESIQPVISLGKRLVIFRLGIVLSNEGGALKEYKKPMKFGIAAILGNGKQMISWIQLDDLCRLFLFAIENASISGVYNAAAPVVISNKNLILQVAKKVSGKSFIPLHVPAFALRIALGELSEELLKSNTLSSQKIKLAGFQFIHPTVETI